MSRHLSFCQNINSLDEYKFSITCHFRQVLLTISLKSYVSDYMLEFLRIYIWGFLWVYYGHFSEYLCRFLSIGFSEYRGFSSVYIGFPWVYMESYKYIMGISVIIYDYLWGGLTILLMFLIIWWGALTILWFLWLFDNNFWEIKPTHKKEQPHTLHIKKQKNTYITHPKCS